MRENAGYDFASVRNKADQIVRLANEIGTGAQRAEQMVRTLSTGDTNPMMDRAAGGSHKGA